MERPVVIPTVYLVLVREGRVLLCRRFNTGFMDGLYGFPAGHLRDDDETLSEALVREAMEEIGVDVAIEDLELVHVMHRKQTELGDERRVNLFFAAKRWKNKPRIMEPDKCDDVRWFGLDGLPDSTIPYVRQAIGCFRKNVKYSEYGF
jgi:8-oxo-dGTP pyrophosphatase MutT (NUDIX family)